MSRDTNVPPPTRHNKSRMPATHTVIRKTRKAHREQNGSNHQHTFRAANGTHAHGTEKTNRDGQPLGQHPNFDNTDARGTRSHATTSRAREEMHRLVHPQMCVSHGREHNTRAWCVRGYRPTCTHARTVHRTECREYTRAVAVSCHVRAFSTPTSHSCVPSTNVHAGVEIHSRIIDMPANTACGACWRCFFLK